MTEDSPEVVETVRIPLEDSMRVVYRGGRVCLFWRVEGNGTHFASRVDDGTSEWFNTIRRSLKEYSLILENAYQQHLAHLEIVRCR